MKRDNFTNSLSGLNRRMAKFRVRSGAALVALALALSIVSINAVQGQPQAKTKAQEVTKAQQTTKATVVKATPLQMETWRKSMVRAQRPKKGCFVAQYPAKTWTEVQCVTPKPVPFRPKRGSRPFTVGNGVDFSAQVTANTSAAEGSFDSITGVTTENGGGGANSYSLQVNTNTFSTTTCSGAANPMTCQGWEQFIYSSTTIGGILIQYWMLGYNNPCPAGWNSDGGGDCFINNSMSTPVPLQPVANLGTMTLSGDITDQVTLTVGGMMFTAPGNNYFPDLTNGWRVTEFNIVGDGGGGAASFNAGSTMVVRTRVNSGTPSLPPTCDGTGFTGETNNLTLVNTPAVEPDVNWPSIIFTQSNVPGGGGSCANADAIGDTHITTFDKVYYDFQASGEFVLASGPGLLVQTRQASGAPTWPNAAVNKAVAIEIGNNRIALYIEPTRFVIDGTATALADGKDLLLPSGVQVSRRGNLYNVTSLSGDRVQAVLNSTWIDVSVGLGRTPQPQERGLLGNPAGDGNALKTISGAMLKMPVAFADLYHGYADGWRVQPNASLFTEANTIKAGIPEKPFYAAQLNTQEAAAARAICTAAKITNKALLDACILDNAVLKDELAAKVFKVTPAPRLVIKPTLAKVAVLK